MRVVSTAEVGVVEGDTLFTFTQEGSVVSAHYSGGRVRLGYLVGFGLLPGFASDMYS